MSRSSAALLRRLLLLAAVGGTAPVVVLVVRNADGAVLRTAGVLAMVGLVCTWADGWRAGRLPPLADPVEAACFLVLGVAVGPENALTAVYPSLILRATFFMSPRRAVTGGLLYLGAHVGATLVDDGQYHVAVAVLQAPAMLLLPAIVAILMEGVRGRARALTREGILHRAAAGLAASTDRETSHAVAAEAAQELAGEGASATLWLGEADELRPAGAPEDTPTHELHELRVVAAGDGVPVVVVALRARGAVRGALVVTGPGAADELVASSLEALADAVALALEAMGVAEQRMDSRFRALVERSSDAIVLVDGRDVVSYASPAAAGLLGVVAGDPVGEKLAIAFPHVRASVPLTELMARARVRAGETDEIDLAVHHADGSVRELEAVALRLADDARFPGVVLSARDVTERRAAERELRESRQQLQAIIDNTPSAIFVKDAAGRVTLTNRSCEEELGRRREEVLGRTVHDLYPERQAERFAAEHREVLRTGTPLFGEESHQGPDGQRTFVTTSFPLRDAAGAAYAVCGIATDISARVRTEQALRESEGLFREMVEVATEGVWRIDADQRTTYVNQSMARMLGREPEDVVGRSPLEFTDEEGAAILASAMERRRRDRVRERYEAKFVHRDGHDVWVLMSATPLVGQDGRWAGALSMATDVTEQRRAEREIARLNHDRDLVLEFAGEGILRLGLDGRTLFANRAAEALLGYSADELVGEELHPLIHHSREDGAAYPADACPTVAAWRDGTTHRTDGEHFWRKDGTSFPVEYTSVPIREDDRVVGAVVVFSDVSARLQAERERAELESRLHRRQRLETVGQLAGGVAHDFNNLLAVISNYADFATEALEPGPVRSDIEEIRDAAGRAAALVQQLLTFSRQDVASIERVDVHRVVADTERLLRRTLGTHIDLVVHHGAGVADVDASPARIEQVLLNLAFNARDAMPDGGELRISVEQVRLSPAERRAIPGATAGPYVRISVADTGTGMSEEVAERALEPFFTTKATGDGSGLGLATVHGVAERAGGHVELLSRPGQGTIAHVLLPPAAASLPGGAVLEAGPVQTGRGERVLIAEDEDGVRELARRILTRHGYQVRCARDGIEALSVLIDPDQVVDVLLTDVVMPGISGGELVARGRRSRPQLPAVLMSGYAERGDADGPDAADGTFVAKPFRKDALLAAVHRALHAGDAVLELDEVAS